MLDILSYDIDIDNDDWMMVFPYGYEILWNVVCVMNMIWWLNVPCFMVCFVYDKYDALVSMRFDQYNYVLD